MLFFVNNRVMKKERNLLILLFGLFVIYALDLIFFDFVKQNWFIFAIGFISIYLMIKSYFFRSDSSLFLVFFSVMLIIILILNNVYGFSNMQLGSIISVAYSVAFLFVYLIFYNMFCFWTFFVNFMLNLPTLLFSFNCINLVLMILFLSGELVLFGIVLLLKKYGKI